VPEVAFTGIRYYKWSVSAAECYCRGCVCQGCFYQEFFKGSEQKCKMKAAVLFLVRKFGRPDCEVTNEEPC
jgi:hypothetical protein